jgi:uncharacterized protein (DUF4415 family)
MNALATVLKHCAAQNQTFQQTVPPVDGSVRRYLPAELAGLYRPVKKAVTLRLDADVLTWFQKQGRGYQTRINQADDGRDEAVRGVT